MSVQQTHLSHPKYRPDIDGLRAVAVLAVVAFHVFPSWARGGFIGVDVFFVISGYLISTIIFENLERGTFSFTEFYARRIKRIFPALLLVLIACFAFGWFTLLANEYKQLGEHIAAGAGFISNFILWNEAGYFDNSAETKPLLHLWSLGIEEQFYIVWPLLLWFAWKRKFNLLTITIVITVTTFILNLKGIKQDIVATFYSPHTRFWELLSGSLLAWFTIYKKDTFTGTKSKIDAWLSCVQIEKQLGDGKTLGNVLSSVGLFLLLYGFWRINKELSFPGKWALLPVLSTIFIITAGSKAWINRIILSNKIAVWFGLISFPLYLWHWPLLSFARVVEGEVPSRSIRIAAVALSIVLAWLTYKFIERPIRLGMASRVNVTLLTLAMLLVGLSGLIVFQNDGFKKEVKGDYGHDTFFEYYDKHYLKCENKNIYNTSNVYKKWTRCWQTKPGQPDIVLLGDSHAEHLLVGLADSLKEKNIVFYIEDGRPALDDLEFKVIFEELKSANKGMYILISDHYVPDYANMSEKLQEDFDAALKYLTNAGHKVAIIGDVLRFEGAPQDCLLQANRPLSRKVPRSKSCVISFEEAASQEKVYEPTLKNLATQYGIPYFSLSRLMCSETECSMINNGRLYYRDSHHLNIDGSSFVGSRLGNMITDSGFLK